MKNGELAWSTSSTSSGATSWPPLPPALRSGARADADREGPPLRAAGRGLPRAAAAGDALRRSVAQGPWNPDNDFRKRSTSDQRPDAPGQLRFSRTLERVKALKRAGCAAHGRQRRAQSLHRARIRAARRACIARAGRPHAVRKRWPIATDGACARWRAGRSGVVAPGARRPGAVDANPLADISATRRIRRLPDGRWLTRDEAGDAREDEARFASPTTGSPRLRPA